MTAVMAAPRDERNVTGRSPPVRIPGRSQSIASARPLPCRSRCVLSPADRRLALFTGAAPSERFAPLCAGTATSGSFSGDGIHMQPLPLAGQAALRMATVCYNADWSRGAGRRRC
jgi:hypothetical protein